MALTEHSEFNSPVRLGEPTDGCAEARGVCRIHGSDLLRMQASHVAEVAALRRRIEVLESTLAQVDAEQRSAFTAGANPAVTTIETHDGTPLALVPVASNEHEPQTQAQDGLAHLESLHEGAAAWDDDDVSFAERVAALAFFREDVDQPARRWFLKDS